MSTASKLLWGEGLFLRPQHFQRQDAYHEARLAEAVRDLHPYAWGVQRLEVDTDALALQQLRLRAVHAVLPDGERLHAPGADELPAAVSLSDVRPGVSELLVHLTLAPLREHASNSAAPSADLASQARYIQQQQPADDWYTQAASAPLTVLRRNLRLVLDHQPRDHLVSMPLLKLRRQGSGGFEIDPHYVPPSLSLAAAPPLTALLRRLLDALQAKVEALYGFHREPSRHVIEFRSGDIASFWLLHTASTAFAGLSHLLHHPGLHPERLYQRLLELAGSLMTFSRQHALAELQPYQHDQPGASFQALEAVLRDLLETVISTRYFALAIEQVKPSFYQARLDSEQISDDTRLFLSVQASLPMSELIDIVPLRAKVGAPDDVEKLVLSAMAGVRVTHQPQVPAAIPVRAGCTYFAIEPRGPLYERMLQGRSLMLYMPAGIADLQLELFALNG
ncbi:type VI secretion system baseplate subunit TssK [Roseateles sp. BYS87W]|uniref:Type VI secretion system baseplate subunit TssK n=1 Tax=Pelomonas baiyunensis TaxID=3299026 RepID=A0ABW7H5F6_9BURK